MFLAVYVYCKCPTVLQYLNVYSITLVKNEHCSQFFQFNSRRKNYKVEVAGIVLCLFLMVPWVGLQYVIQAFPG